MLDYVYKFFEYLPLYVALVLAPAIVRSVVDTVVIKIPASAFDLPPSSAGRRSIISVKGFIIRFEDAYGALVSNAFYAPVVEEMVFRGAPYTFLGLAGLVVGNVAWILAHPAWQLRYITGLNTKQKIGFTLNSIFYYTCGAIFFSIPWLQGYGLLAVVYHMLHNGFIVLGGIFSEIELPAPWKKESGEYFKEVKGVKKKLEEKFFRDTNPPKESIEEPELTIDIRDSKFFKELAEVAKKTNVKPTATASKKTVAVKPAKAVAKQMVKSVASTEDIGDDWMFWK